MGKWPFAKICRAPAFLLHCNANAYYQCNAFLVELQPSCNKSSELRLIKGERGYSKSVIRVGAQNVIVSNHCQANGCKSKTSCSIFIIQQILRSDIFDKILKISDTEYTQNTFKSFNVSTTI